MRKSDLSDLRNRSLALSVIERFGANRTGFRRVDPGLVEDLKKLLSLESDLAEKVHEELNEAEFTYLPTTGKPVSETNWLGHLIANWMESHPDLAKACGLDHATRRNLVKIEAMVPEDLAKAFSGQQAGRTCPLLGEAVGKALKEYVLSFPHLASDREALSRIKEGVS